MTGVDHGRSTPSGLLVSVRSASEARSAWKGGASVIDVKEPTRGPLGCADVETWAAVRRAVPASLTVSVALGDLRDWNDRSPPPPSAFEGVAFRKLGFAGEAGRDWRRRWQRLRRSWEGGASWVAVAYLDAELAGAPSCDEIRDGVASDPDCAGLMLDTWRKGPGSDAATIDVDWLATIRDAGRFVALAGGLDEASIARLGPLDLDLIGVRGAACRGGDRLAEIDPSRVRALRRAVDRLMLNAARSDSVAMPEG